MSDERQRTRIAVEGHLATYGISSGLWVPGPACNLQFTRHAEGWLVQGWGVADAAVLITVADGHRIADVLGGVAA